MTRWQRQRLLSAGTQRPAKGAASQLQHLLPRQHSVRGWPQSQHLPAPESQVAPRLTDRFLFPAPIPSPHICAFQSHRRATNPRGHIIVIKEVLRVTSSSPIREVLIEVVKHQATSTQHICFRCRSSLSRSQQRAAFSGNLVDDLLALPTNLWLFQMRPAGIFPLGSGIIPIRIPSPG
jgi:hypothetical protein